MSHDAKFVICASFIYGGAMLFAVGVDVEWYAGVGIANVIHGVLLARSGR